MVDTKCDAMEIECLPKLSPSICKVMGSHLNPRPFAEYTVDLTQAPKRVKQSTMKMHRRMEEVKFHKMITLAHI
jgi:hypothetical protein